MLRALYEDFAAVWRHDYQIERHETRRLGICIAKYDHNLLAYRQKLLAMGLTPGTEFQVLRIAPLGDSSGAFGTKRRRPRSGACAGPIRHKPRQLAGDGRAIHRRVA